ncbi:MAG: hypothetical protein U5L03_06275, partial [Burkholderiaceae bacterium]|nr:hypothetical protein [Burkholderiaceae bacterium]
MTFRLPRFFAPVLAAALVAFAPPAPAKSLPASVEQVHAVEGITEYRLANGLRVLFYPDAAKQQYV